MGEQRLWWEADMGEQRLWWKADMGEQRLWWEAGIVSSCYGGKQVL